MANIGFIGLGNMGTPMVTKLLEQHQVTVYDINPKTVKELTKKGAIAANHVCDIACSSHYVFTMLQTSEQVLDVCYHKKLFQRMNSDCIYIDCSSINRSDSLKIHGMAATHSLKMLDAPVSGGVKAAQAGTLTFMVGGPKPTFEDVKPILSCMGQKIIYAGNKGAGSAAKICNNLLLGISMIGVCEAFTLAEKLELDPKKFFEIASNASGNCWSLSQYCPWPNILENVPSSHGYKPGFSAQMMLKDLKLSQIAAAEAGIKTPLAKHAEQLYERFVADYGSPIDFSGILKMIQND